MKQIPNRRNFIAGTLGAAVLAGRPAQAQENLSDVNIAFIGVGNRGYYALENILQLPSVKVTALCDTKGDRLDKAATTAVAHKPFTTADYKKLLEREDVDAVYIATPCDRHVEMAIAALEAGKHVYCEKPIGITPESIASLVKVARGSQKVFQAGQQLRSVQRLGQTIAKIHEGVIGKVIMIKAQRHSSQDLDHEGPSKDWFFNAKRSGDVLVEMSVHNIDICNWVVGEHPERAAGFGGTLKWVDDPPGRTNMDGYTLSYEYPGGAKLSYTQVFFHPRGMPGGGAYFYVYGTKGAVDLNTSQFYPEVSERGSRPQTLVEPIEEDDRAHFKAFFNAIRTGGENPAGIDIAAAAAITAVIGREAIYQKTVTEWPKLGLNL